MIRLAFSIPYLRNATVDNITICIDLIYMYLHLNVYSENACFFTAHSLTSVGIIKDKKNFPVFYLL